MPDGLYERDALLWSEQQSELLRRLARGERVNDDIDWPNVIEELQDVGLSELHGCESMIRQAIRHLLKLASDPENEAARHWTGETLEFLASAQDYFTPSMRQRIDLHKQYSRALKSTNDLPRSLGPRPPELCPFSLDDLLAEDADPKALATRLM
jgi:hypothetical protein